MKRRGRRGKAPRTDKSRGTPTPVWFGMLIVVLAGIVVYWNSFDVPLVFDDYLSVQNNADVRFGDALRPGTLGGRSLLYVTFAINYALHEQDVWGYHFVSLLLHLLNGILVLFSAEHVLRRVEVDDSRVRAYAVLAATFFAVHPVQTQAVTYISSRSEVLSTFFYLLAFLLFIKTPDHRIGFLFSLPIAAIAYLGLQSKETAISIPAVLLAYDFLMRADAGFRPLFTRWRFYATFLAGAGGVAYLLLTGPLRASVGGTLTGHLTPWHYLLTQTRVIVHYIRLVFLPVGLNLDHDFAPSASPFEPAVLVSSALILGLISLAWYLRRRAALVSFSIFWFFLTLAPTSSIAPILDVIFEHRLYLPMVGLCFSFPLVLARALEFFKKRTQFRAKVVPVGSGILALLMVGTVLRNEVWRDEVRLWSDVVKKSPDKARGYNALAMSYFRRGEYEPGLEVAQTGLERNPADRNLFVDTMGNFYLQLGRYEEATEAFHDVAQREAARDLPDRDFVEMEYNNLGVTYLYMWRFVRQNETNMTPAEFDEAKRRVLEPALDAFGKSLEWGSDMFTAFDSYVNVVSWLDRSDELRGEHEALLAEAENFKSRYILAKLAFNRDDFETAVGHFEKALDPDPREQLVWFNYGYALDRVGRLDDAIDIYTRAIRFNPTFIEAHHNVGLLRMRKSEFDVAIQNFEEVLRLFPQHLSANLHLAKIYLQTGNRPLARRHLATVLDASPDHQEALSLWQQWGS